MTEILTLYRGGMVAVENLTKTIFCYRTIMNKQSKIIGGGGKLIGRIIFAHLLGWPLWRYFTFVEQVESHPLFQQWLQHGWVWKENLSTLPSFLFAPTRKDAVIGEYVKQGHGEYGIRYCHPYFQRCYGTDKELWYRFADGTVEKKFLTSSSPGQLAQRPHPSSLGNHCQGTKGLSFNRGHFPSQAYDPGRTGKEDEPRYE